jgi:hypothetical protein
MLVRQGLPAVVLATIVALAGAACSRQKAPPATAVDVVLAVQRDGSLLVEETLRVRIDQPISTFRRASPRFRHDGIDEVRAALDGKDVPHQEGPTRYSWRDDELEVVWTFPAMTGEHTFGVTYRAMGVVEVSGIRGRVSWMAMPPDHGFDIGTMNVSLALPPGVVQIGDPWVMEAGWTVAREPIGMRATRTNVRAGEGVHVGAEFTIDTLNLPQPAWQYHEARADEFKLAFLSGGAFLLVVAAGIVVMIRLRLSGIEPGPAREAERATTAQGLRITATVTMVAGVAGWFLVRLTLGTYGPWPYALPISTILSAAVFQYTSRLYRLD